MELSVIVPCLNEEANLPELVRRVGEVFKNLVDQYPGLSDNLLGEDGNLHKFVNVYRNDDDIRYLEQLDTTVSDGDEISILPAVAGGAV